QLSRGPVDRRADLYAVGVMLWEMLTGQRFRTDASFTKVKQDLEGGAPVLAPTSVAPSPAAAALEPIVLKAMSAAPEGRYATARAMAEDIERAVPPAPASAVLAWCQSVADDRLT